MSFVAVVEWICDFYLKPWGWTIISVAILMGTGAAVRVPYISEQGPKPGIVIFEICGVGSRLHLAALGMLYAAIVGLAKNNGGARDTLGPMFLGGLVFVVFVFVSWLEYRFGQGFLNGEGSAPKGEGREAEVCTDKAARYGALAKAVVVSRVVPVAAGTLMLWFVCSYLAELDGIHSPSTSWLPSIWNPKMLGLLGVLAGVVTLEVYHMRRLFKTVEYLAVSIGALLVWVGAQSLVVSALMAITHSRLVSNLLGFVVFGIGLVAYVVFLREVLGRLTGYRHGCYREWLRTALSLLVKGSGELLADIGWHKC